LKRSSVSSLVLLQAVMQLVRGRGGRLVNVDATVVAQAPKLAPLLGEMAKRLADALGIDAGAVSVKAKSPEGLGLLGREEGMAAMAVVSVEVG
jgi:2-C-methyl-D-erythritol 2,4-cyclodiphosphate synthase